MRAGRPARAPVARPSLVASTGWAARSRRFLPELIQVIWDRKTDPGKVFDLVLPLEKAVEGYAVMDERRATKVMLTF